MSTTKNETRNKRRASVVVKPQTELPSASSKGKPKVCVKPKSSLAFSSSNGEGGSGCEADTPRALSQPNGKPKVDMKPRNLLASLCLELQGLQRQRTVYIKSRIMVGNRLQALVAGTMGYSSGMKEAERRAVFSEAGKLIQRVVEGEEHAMSSMILVHYTGISEFVRVQKELEKKMVARAKQLPVAAWLEAPEQKGFGMQSLATVIGEAGDLNNYANPAKVWRRMGCAPWTFRGETKMGATWRSGKEGKLPAEEWTNYGYSPRRRSLAYLIGEGLVKQNGEGPYRQRYDEAKARAAETHPGWTCCSKCEGSGKTKKGSKCSNCKGTGVVMKRCHLHGMLLATKLLFKNLWLEWTGAENHPWNGKD